MPVEVRVVPLVVHRSDVRHHARRRLRAARRPGARASRVRVLTPRITSGPTPRFSVLDAKPSRSAARCRGSTSSPGVRWSRSGSSSSGRGTSSRAVFAQSGSSSPSDPSTSTPALRAPRRPRSNAAARESDALAARRPVRAASPSPAAGQRARGSAAESSRSQMFESPLGLARECDAPPAGRPRGCARASGDLGERFGLAAARRDRPQLPSAAPRGGERDARPVRRPRRVDVVSRAGDERRLSAPPTRPTSRSAAALGAALPHEPAPVRRPGRAAGRRPATGSAAAFARARVADVQLVVPLARGDERDLHAVRRHGRVDVAGEQERELHAPRSPGRTAAVATALRRESPAAEARSRPDRPRRRRPGASSGAAIARASTCLGL